MKNLWLSCMLLAPALASLGCPGDLSVAKDAPPDGAFNGDAGSSSSPPVDATTAPVQPGATSSPPNGTTSGQPMGVVNADADTSVHASPGVSFAADIMPIFQMSCTLSSVCHGQVGNTSEESLYLGPNVGGTPSTQIHDLLVGVPSMEDPSMNLVTAGDPANSYLWVKVSGDPNSNPSVVKGCAMAASACASCTTSQPCGVMQPLAGEMLPTDTLGEIRNWIAQGAKNN
jgi:hypothetical protein